MEVLPFFCFGISGHAKQGTSMFDFSYAVWNGLRFDVVLIPIPWEEKRYR
jgi:hypothetical protein